MPIPPDTRAPRLLVLHRVQDAWSAVLAQPGIEGLLIESCSRLSDADLPGWVAQQDVASVRVVLAGSAVVCRTVALGEEADEALLEEQLLSAADSRPAADTPMHRCGMAVLPAVDGGSQRTGVVLGWPESDQTTLPKLPVTPLAVPDVVGLLQLASAGSAAAWIDADAGSIALMLQGSGSLVARCVREADPASAVSAVLQESASLSGSAGVSLPESGALRLNTAAAAQLAALSTNSTTEITKDPDLYGIAVACAAACSSTLAPLTVLQTSSPSLQLSRPQRAVAAMRTPGTAAVLVAAAVAVLFIGPVLINGLRLTMLRAAHPELGDAVAAAAQAESRNQYYRVLGTEAWPMTKLLSDIGAAAPLGIVLEQIRIDHGEPIRIKGYASPRGGESAADLITRMKADLQASGVFDEVRVEWDGKKRIGQREFTIVAGVRDAKRRPRYVDENDYAAWTHQQRRHSLAKTTDGGPPARPSELSNWDPTAAERIADAAAEASTAAPVLASADDGADTASASTGGTRPSGQQTGHSIGRPSGRNPRAGDAGSSVPVDPTTIVREGHGSSDGREHIDSPGGNGSAKDSGSTSVGSAEFQSGDLDSGALGAMPQILANEQLAALSEDELRAKLSEVTQARERIRDPEQSAQLRDYFKRIFDRLRELRRNGTQP